MTKILALNKQKSNKVNWLNSLNPLWLVILCTSVQHTRKQF